MARILVVDDQAELAELIQTVLEGHAVEAVLGGQAALERLGQAVYDLVVCDLAMPDVDGSAVYRAVQQLAPPRPAVLLMTGYADGPTYAEFLADDADVRIEQADRHRCAAGDGHAAAQPVTPAQSGHLRPSFHPQRCLAQHSRSARTASKRPIGGRARMARASGERPQTAQTVT